MCLLPEYFEDKPRRKFMRDLIGVRPEVAKRDLDRYSSTVYPVAYEMAEWLLDHWGAIEIERRLGRKYLLIVHQLTNSK